MNKDLLKVGEVIEVKGIKIRAKVYKEKNTPYLNYDGKIIKNIAVGRFVKIKNGFNDIVGKIEGEYVVEENNISGYKSSNALIHRIIEISIVGSFDNDGFFKKGLFNLPLVADYIYILKEEEVDKIFCFSKKNEKRISTGNIISYDTYKLRLSVQNLFASHIGIFGNTGSGKSNTLAKIYSELFKIYGDKKNFKDKSEFILIDFNGEYHNSITQDGNKEVYNLSTSEEGECKYPLNKEILYELEFWAIITEATEKTQQPFLKSCIRLYEDLCESENLVNKIEIIVKKIINNIFNYGEKYGTLRKEYEEMIDLAFDNIAEKSILEKLSYVNRNNSSSFIIKNNISGNVWLDTAEQFKENKEIKSLQSNIIGNKCIFTGDNINYFQLFNFAVRVNYILEIQKGYINEEHIGPLMKRLNNRLHDIEKVFTFNKAINKGKNLKIISLLDVNVTMRKIIPMIICKKIYDEHKKDSNKGFLNIIIDEAHNILSTNSQRESAMWKDYRLEVFEEIIKEGRKFGTFLTISSQRPSDISETIISQLHNYFLHRLVNNEDIKAIGRSVSFLDSTSYEMIPILPQGACIFTGISSNFPILVQVDELAKDRQPKSDTIKINDLWNDDNL
ncbi:ATP-binding protein [Clostridium butyricum]|uniref:ATP-binding protein n=1 Tax=Clostridium butyricum TaxID=1492 RepID=UPI00374E8FEB